MSALTPIKARSMSEIRPAERQGEIGAMGQITQTQLIFGTVIMAPMQTKKHDWLL